MLNNLSHRPLPHSVLGRPTPKSVSPAESDVQPSEIGGLRQSLPRPQASAGSRHSLFLDLLDILRAASLLDVLPRRAADFPELHRWVGWWDADQRSHHADRPCEDEAASAEYEGEHLANAAIHPTDGGRAGTVPRTDASRDPNDASDVDNDDYL